MNVKDFGGQTLAGAVALTALLCTSIIGVVGAVEVPRRISSVRVDHMSLEIEQPTGESKLLIRVSDYRASSHSEIVASVWFARQGVGEEKVQDVILKRVDTGLHNIEYVGEFIAGKEFSHGAIGKVVYQSEGLPPISTWIYFFYH